MTKKCLQLFLAFSTGVYLEGTPDTVQVMSDHKALEYFMMTKALTAQQACWAEILSQFNFWIMYKPGATNHADALTRWEQDLDNQIAKKIALQTLTLLGPECLDPQIQAELRQGPLKCRTVALSIVQFARPVVVFNFLFQMISTPPPHSVFDAIWPPATLLSSSNRKLSVSLCFTSSNIRSLVFWMGPADMSNCKPLMLDSKLVPSSSSCCTFSGFISEPSTL